MNVAGVEIDVRHSHTQRFLQGRQRAMNAGGRFPARVDASGFLFGVEQQNLAVVIIRNAIDRAVCGERAANIIALAQQPLGQDSLANLPLLLPVVRQSVLAA